MTRFEDCAFEARGDRIVLENSRIRRVYLLRDGVLTTASLAGLPGPREAPAFCYTGYIPVPIRKPKLHPFRIDAVRARAVRDSFLEAAIDLQDPLQGLSIRIAWRLFPGVAAIRTHLEVRAEHAPRCDFDSIEVRHVLDTIPAPFDSLAVHRFYGRTDLKRECRKTVSLAAPAARRRFEGNLAVLQDRDGRGLFVLKEHPPFDEQRREVPCDFEIGGGIAEIHGWGLRPWEILPDRHRATYGWVVGSFDGGDDGMVRALKAYQNARYPRNPRRDDQLMANPWGDGRCATRMTERYLVEDLRACAGMGIPIYQPDDGWQEGHPSGHRAHVVENLVLPGNAWRFRRRTLPRGFGPVAREAKRLGVRLGLWFSPGTHREFRNWREHADLLLSLHRRFGIETFKLDTAWIRTKDGEERFEALCRALVRGGVALNLDVTQGPRWGYFRMLEYGNLFLENRFVHNPALPYRPEETLRNLWDLAPFVPTRKLQIEVPRVRQDQGYAMAVAMFANPLIWAEPKRFARGARREIASLVRRWKEIKGDVFSGDVVPIGERPDGRSFTGFQSIGRDGSATAILFRERSRAASHEFLLRGLRPGPYLLDGRPYRVGREARLAVRFDRPNDFRIVRIEPADRARRAGEPGPHRPPGLRAGRGFP